ncbi:hypothetical protein [Streptomyces fagopyri]
MTRSVQAVASTGPSLMESVPGGGRLGCETSRGATPIGITERLPFREDLLMSPQVSATGVLAIADAAADARYHRRQLPSPVDPLITDGGDRLRHCPRLRCARAPVAAGAVVLDAALGTVAAQDGRLRRVRTEYGRRTEQGTARIDGDLR